MKRVSHIPAACAVAAFIGMTGLYLYGDRHLYETILSRWGVEVWAYPFLDLQNPLAAWECSRLGLNVYITNPCDGLHRPYIYGPLWVWLSFVPLDQTDLWWTGWLFGMAFIVSLAFLPAVRRPWEIAVMVGAYLSPAVVFGIERANLDIILVALAVGVAHLAVAQARFAAFGLIVICTLLKYYPVTMLVLAFRERAMAFWSITGAAFMVFLLVALIDGADIARALANVPNGNYLFGTFSAHNLPRGLHRMLGISPWFVMAALLAIFLRGVWTMSAASAVADFERLPELHRVCLVIGSSLMVGCFFLSENIAYRQAGLLLVLPGLLVMARKSAVMKIAAGAILLVLWDGFFRSLWGIPAVNNPDMMAAPPTHWFLREVMWWFIAAVMSTILVRFIANSRALADVLEMLPYLGMKPRMRR